MTISGYGIPVRHDSTRQRRSGALEPRRELGEVRNDEPRGCRRRGRSRIGDEVGERLVLLMADGRDDRHRAGRERAEETLVAERKEVFEAAAAAGEDDDVDLVCVADLAERLGDRGCGTRALDVGLGDEDPSRRKARGDRGQHVSLGRGVVSRDEPDASRKARKRPFPLGREEAFVGELPLQALESGEMVAEAEALDRQGLEAKVSASREQLGTPEDVDALSVRELEPERVELSAGHRHAEARAVGGIFQREEDALPALLATEIRDLALDPDGRQARKPVADAAVEGGHAEDPPVPVFDRLDLHARMLRPEPRLVVTGTHERADRA